jgi:hypothetical protein
MNQSLSPSNALASYYLDVLKELKCCLQFSVDVVRLIAEYVAIEPVLPCIPLGEILGSLHGFQVARKVFGSGFKTRKTLGSGSPELTDLNMFGFALFYELRFVGNWVRNEDLENVIVDQMPQDFEGETTVHVFQPAGQKLRDFGCAVVWIYSEQID